MTIPTEVAAVLAEMRASPSPDWNRNNALDGWAGRIESALTKAEAVETSDVKFPDGVQCRGCGGWNYPGGLPCCKSYASGPAGMVYPPKPAPRAHGYLDGSGVEWAAYDTVQMEAYARLAYAAGLALYALTKAEAEPVAWIRATMVETLTKEVTHLIKCGAKQEHPNDVPLYAHAPPVVPVESLGMDAKVTPHDWCSDRGCIGVATGDAEECRPFCCKLAIGNAESKARAAAIFAKLEDMERKNPLSPKPAEPVASVPDGWDIHRDRYVSGIMHIRTPDNRICTVAAGDDGRNKILFELAKSLIDTPATNQEGAAP